MDCSDKRTDHAPCGRVVHVQRRRLTPLHGLDEGIHHEEIHASVPPTLRVFRIPLPQRVVVRLLVGLERLPAMRFRAVTLGGSGSCTIYNTVFFEGIPSLNQFGLMILALLMLGVGAVAFRRLA